MRVGLPIFLVAVLAGSPFAGARQAAAGSDQAAIVAFAQKAGMRAVNFEMGDAASLERARADFTADGWKDFMKHMAGYLDEKGAPAFNSSFTPSGEARVVDETDGIVHVKIPGTLKQGNKISATTYKAALEVYAGGKPVKIQKLEQVTCAGKSTACQ
jgi:hypothetical protein